VQNQGQSGQDAGGDRWAGVSRRVDAG